MGKEPQPGAAVDTVSTTPASAVADTAQPGEIVAPPDLGNVDRAVGDTAQWPKIARWVTPRSGRAVGDTAQWPARWVTPRSG